MFAMKRDDIVGIALNDLVHQTPDRLIQSERRFPNLDRDTGQTQKALRVSLQNRQIVGSDFVHI
jgi:hypothetical protein